MRKIIEEEYEHYEYFNEAMIKKNKTNFNESSLASWRIFAWCYTSFMGEKYVNACTEAVEEVIVEHYEDQIKFLEKGY